MTYRHQTLVQGLPEWLNGTANVTPRSVEQLYDDELAVNVARANGNNPSLIRGRLVSRLVADSRDSITPYLLKRSDTSVPADMVGLIWARVDGECNLHFDVRYGRAPPPSPSLREEGSFVCRLTTLQRAYVTSVN